MPTSESRALIVTNAVLLALAASAVCLRIGLRKNKVTCLQADDFLIIAALVLSTVLVVTHIIGGAIGGFGISFGSLSDDQVVLFLKILFIEQFWYIIAVALIKLSVLCFYGRLFSARRWPKMIWAMIGITIAWLISFLFATFFQVWPIWCNWSYCIPTTNYPVMYVCCSVTDILLDIMILCIPVQFVKQLQITTAQKVALTSVFGLGIFCIVSSIARLAYTVVLVEANVDANFASNFGSGVVNMIMWSGIEACASIVCANLPCYGSLFKDSSRVKSMIASMRSRSSGRKSSRGRKLSYSGRNSDRYASLTLQKLSSLERPMVETGGTKTSIRGGETRYWPENELQSGQIKIDVTMGVHQDV